jgi:putative ribosome biogenesis GTPase RsgA
MRETYKARVINICGETVTYEYSDSSGFVQISSLRPTNIKLNVGDTVWITVENGAVITVTKRRTSLSAPFGAKLFGMLAAVIALLVLWLIFKVIKKIIIAFVWIFIIVIAAAFIFTKFRR